MKYKYTNFLYNYFFYFFNKKTPHKERFWVKYLLHFNIIGFDINDNRH